jgi:threonine/homoserine/homoserine lactone efflux protein
MWSYLGLGFSMGLSAGLSPGPLLALVLTASLRSGFRGGLVVALAPLLTDAPIIALSVLLIGRLSPEILRWIGILGAGVVIWMGVSTLRAGRHATLPGQETKTNGTRSELWRGVVVNALNPHPYLFWATVGGPALVGGWRRSPGYALAFLIPFYGLLVGSKILLAWLVSRQAGRLNAVWYRRALAIAGLLLLLMGGWLIWQMYVQG